MDPSVGLGLVGGFGGLVVVGDWGFWGFVLAMGDFGLLVVGERSLRDVVLEERRCLGFVGEVGDVVTFSWRVRGS